MNINVVHENYDDSDTISIDTLALYEDLEKERTNEISQLSRLSKKVCCLHTKLLYYRNNDTELGVACYAAWKSIIRCVEGSANCWRELGYYLGISQDDLDYIKHSIKYDPTDVILKLFMQEEDATLDKIIDAFNKMKRYDILKKIEEPLTDMAAHFNKDEEYSDTGYQSHDHSRDNDKRKITTLKTLNINLPPALRKLRLQERKPNPEQPKQIETDITEKSKNNCPLLFLTFSEDGIEAAMNIQDKLNDWFDLEVQVITLEDHKEDVIQNPEKFIRQSFEKADYIVPILTTGYLKEINSCSPSTSNTSNNLDCKYANYIYNLITNQYMHVTGCLNIKVRSVLPENADLSVLMGISMYPALMPWTHESNFDEQFRVFLKEYFS